MEVVAHRGPDAQSVHHFRQMPGNPVMAHVRLAIVDTDARSNQPFACRNKRYWLTYNGQIYNYLELRKELEADGVAFRTDGDTEVVLNAWIHWGEDCLDRFEGMFAFVVHDSATGDFHAARDRFGIKPLYLLELPAGFAFASEIKQFMAINGFHATADDNMLSQFLADGTLDHSARTMFRNVSQVPPAHLVAGNAGHSGQLSKRRWYSLASSPRSIPRTEALEAFSALFQRAIELHLRSDVPAGGCLSAGLDSSLISLAVSRSAAGRHSGSYQTVTASSSVSSLDESRLARQTANMLGLRHHIAVPDESLTAAEFDAQIYRQDEPFSGMSLIAQDAVFRMAASRGIKVMLDGQGADELLCGYRQFHRHHLGALLRRGSLTGFLRAVRDRAAHEELPAIRQIAGALASAFLPAFSVRHEAGLAAAWMRDVPHANPPQSFHQRRLWQITKGMLPALLHWEDRNSMAYSIEARVPFLHHPLVEFIMNLDIDNLYDLGKTKPIIRQMLEGEVPGEIVNRRHKIGFEMPMEGWLRRVATIEEMPDFARLSRAAGNRIDTAMLESAWQDFAAGERGDPALFRAYCASRWLDVFGL